MLSSYIDRVTDDKGLFRPERICDSLRMRMQDLALLVHLRVSTLTGNPERPNIQTSLGEIARIIVTASEMLGSEGKAIIWFRFQPLTGFDGKTAAELVRDGQVEVVLTHLEMLREGLNA